LKAKLFDVMLVLGVLLVLAGTMGGAYYSSKHEPPPPRLAAKVPPGLAVCDLMGSISGDGSYPVYECDTGDRQCVVIVPSNGGTPALSCVYR
jgi:hypothetical protein